MFLLVVVVMWYVTGSRVFGVRDKFRGFAD